jgi:hypothetical protein
MTSRLFMQRVDLDLESWLRRHDHLVGRRSVVFRSRVPAPAVIQRPWISTIGKALVVGPLTTILPMRAVAIVGHVGQR